MALADITAFIRLDDGTGLSGMPTADQCREVKQAGYQSVVNLAPEGSPSALPAEPAIWAELGLDYTICGTALGARVLSGVVLIGNGAVICPAFAVRPYDRWPR